MKTQLDFLQFIRATREYAAIAAFYADRKAKRSQVPLMHHIDEGCAILWEYAHLQAERDPQATCLQDALACATLAARAYCLHPLFQADPDLASAGRRVVSQCDPQMVMFAMEYRARANDWLSDKVVLRDGTPVSQGEPSPGVLHEVRLMLVADKVQNHKDFAQHHRGTHAHSAELEHYFQHWLRVLGIDAVAYERLTAAAAQVADLPAAPQTAHTPSCSQGCVETCLAQLHGCASECPALPRRPPFEQAALEPNIDVRTILLAVVPGDGSGEEVFAKSVDDVVAKLTELSEQAESLRDQVDSLTAAASARERETAELKATVDLGAATAAHLHQAKERLRDLMQRMEKHIPFDEPEIRQIAAGLTESLGAAIPVRATSKPAPAERAKFHPLPYATALELYRACKRGHAKFVLHYHGEEPRALTGVGLGNDCIWVEAGCMLPVHIRHDGSSKDGPSIWLEQRPAADAPATPDTSSD